MGLMWEIQGIHLHKFRLKKSKKSKTQTKSLLSIIEAKSNGQISKLAAEIHSTIDQLDGQFQTKSTMTTKQGRIHGYSSCVRGSRGHI